MFEANPKGAQVTNAVTMMNSPSAEHTRDSGRSLGATLKGGEIVLLTGSLGAGKSVFARGIADALGVRAWRGSPTFSLVHEYRSTPALYHLDLYRLTAHEVEDLGLDEYADEESVMVVEWADRAETYLRSLSHSRLIAVDLEHATGDTRDIRIEVGDSDPIGRTPC